MKGLLSYCSKRKRTCKQLEQQSLTSKKFIRDATYEEDFPNEFVDLIQVNDENVGTYFKNFKLIVWEMSAVTRSSEYQQMLKFMEGLFEVYNNHKTARP